jgi:hypothetical protein
MTLKLIIYCYIVINSFIAGASFKESEGAKLTPRFLWVFLNLLFGIMIYILDGIRYLAIFIAVFINKNLRIVFFFEYFFTRKWHNVEKCKLRFLNWKVVIFKRKFEKEKTKPKFSTRMFFFTVDLINERNGLYDFSAESHCPHCNHELGQHELKEFDECYKCGKKLNKENNYETKNR